MKTGKRCAGRPKIPVPREADILRACLATLRVRWGLRVERVNTGAMRLGGRYVAFGTRGRSDISGLLGDGRRLEVEVKRPGGKPTEAQLAWMHAVNESGGVAFWVDDAAQIDAVMPRLRAGRGRKSGKTGWPTSWIDGSTTAVASYGIPYGNAGRSD